MRKNETINKLKEFSIFCLSSNRVYAIRRWFPKLSNNVALIMKAIIKRHHFERLISKITRAYRLSNRTRVRSIFVNVLQYYNYRSVVR